MLQALAQLRGPLGFSKETGRLSEAQEQALAIACARREARFKAESCC